MQQGIGLQNKRVIILGGSSRIGLAVAQQASSQRANVVIVSSNLDRIQKAVQSLRGRAEGQTADPSDERAVAALFTMLGQTVIVDGGTVPV
jgi:NAD(P)-dependent dehydrogenase (short-subunit alcohol dehydrogenase family)